MLYSKAPRALFVHIPKNAGSSIRQALLDAPGSGFRNKIQRRGLLRVFHKRPHIKLRWHYFLSSFLEVAGNDALEGLFSFAIVRNPWERLFSRWNFLWQQSPNYLDKDGQPVYQPDKVREQGFERWLYEGMDYVMTGPGQWSNIIDTPQRDWLSDASGKVRITGVGRFEQLEPFINTVEKQLGCPLPRLHLKKTDRDDYRASFTPAMVDLVAQRFKPDIDLWEYSYE